VIAVSREDLLIPDGRNLLRSDLANFLGWWFVEGSALGSFPNHGDPAAQSGLFCGRLWRLHRDLAINLAITAWIGEWKLFAAALGIVAAPRNNRLCSPKSSFAQQCNRTTKAVWPESGRPGSRIDLKILLPDRRSQSGRCTPQTPDRGRSPISDHLQRIAGSWTDGLTVGDWVTGQVVSNDGDSRSNFLSWVARRSLQCAVFP